MVGCRGICNRYQAIRRRKINKGTARYLNGQKRCQNCEIFVDWEGLWCPCCGYRLRTRPRNPKFKEKFRKHTNSLLKDMK